MQKTFPTNKMPPRSYGISSVLHATCIVFRNVLRVLATETSVSRYLTNDSCAPVWSTRRANQRRNLKVRCFNVVHHSEYGYTTRAITSTWYRLFEQFRTERESLRIRHRFWHTILACTLSSHLKKKSRERSEVDSRWVPRCRTRFMHARYVHTRDRESYVLERAVSVAP